MLVTISDVIVRELIGTGLHDSFYHSVLNILHSGRGGKSGARFLNLKGNGMGLLRGERLGGADRLICLPDRIFDFFSVKRNFRSVSFYNFHLSSAAAGSARGRCLLYLVLSFAVAVELVYITYLPKGSALSIAQHVVVYYCQILQDLVRCGLQKHSFLFRIKRKKKNFCSTCYTKNERLPMRAFPKHAMYSENFENIYKLRQSDAKRRKKEV